MLDPGDECIVQVEIFGFLESCMAAFSALLSWEWLSNFDTLTRVLLISALLSVLSTNSKRSSNS